MADCVDLDTAPAAHGELRCEKPSVSKNARSAFTINTIHMSCSRASVRLRYDDEVTGNPLAKDASGC